LRDANRRSVVATGNADEGRAAEAAAAQISLLMAEHDFLTGLPTRSALPCRPAQPGAELIRAGAADFTTSSAPGRLPGAMRRSVRETRALREREVAVVELAASEARFKTLVANLPGVVFQCLFGPAGPMHWLFLSERCDEIIGVERVVLLGDAARFADAVLEEDRPSLAAACHGACKKGQTFAWEGRLSPGTGAAKWISMRATTVCARNGQVMADGLISDITASKLAEAELLRAHAQLREFSLHLDRAREEERASIAREIHDELGMLLTAAKIEIATVARRPPQTQPAALLNGPAEALIDQAMEASRRISRRLRPAILDCGIVAAVESQAREFAKRLGIPCSFDETAEEIQLGSEQTTAVFRIFQEALTNIARHARARRVRVALVEDADGFVTLRVTDNGRGMSAADAAKPGSFGLRGMRERAHGLGGQLGVRSAPGEGTQITLRVPLAPPGEGRPRLSAAAPFAT
jgi:two-component system, NarL family, sensor histidine kinase UhpB